tara:strand:+ start:237 stop:425 length:189 start_codon:yes stop_codon:yes gene_type:complete
MEIIVGITVLGVIAIIALNAFDLLPSEEEPSPVIEETKEVPDDAIGLGNGGVETIKEELAND